MTALLTVSNYAELEAQQWELPSNISTHHYGAQLSTPLLDFKTTIRGQLLTTDSVRLLQLNQYVTSGVTPAGRPNGFHTQSLSRRKSAANALTEDHSSGDGTLLPFTTNMAISRAIDLAVDLALLIRVEQWFFDGNHRTALAALVFSLAEHGVILASSFDAYHAYTIISARFHPGNESNYLNTEARLDSQLRLKRYLKSRTCPLRKTQLDSDDGVMISRRLIDYLEGRLNDIRLLPITVMYLNACYNELQRLAAERDWKKRLRVWRSLNDCQRGHAKLTFPDLAKGPLKLR